MKFNIAERWLFICYRYVNNWMGEGENILWRYDLWRVGSSSGMITTAENYYSTLVHTFIWRDQLIDKQKQRFAKSTSLLFSIILLSRHKFVSKQNEERKIESKQDETVSLPIQTKMRKHLGYIFWARHASELVSWTPCMNYSWEASPKAKLVSPFCKLAFLEIVWVAFNLHI